MRDRLMDFVTGFAVACGLLGIVVVATRQPNEYQQVAECRLQVRKDQLYFSIYERNLKLVTDSLNQYRIWVQRKVVVR